MYRGDEGNRKQKGDDNADDHRAGGGGGGGGGGDVGGCRRAHLSGTGGGFNGASGGGRGKARKRKGLITKEGKRYGIAPHKHTYGGACWVVIDTVTMRLANPGCTLANEKMAWEQADNMNAVEDARPSRQEDK